MTEFREHATDRGLDHFWLVASTTQRLSALGAFQANSRTREGRVGQQALRIIYDLDNGYSALGAVCPLMLSIMPLLTS